MTDDEFEVVDLFLRGTMRWPRLADRLAKASSQIAGTTALVGAWRRDQLPRHLPWTDHRWDLAARLCIYAILISERALDVGRGAAYALEADLLFSAATGARSELEIVGQAQWLRAEVEEARRTNPPDTSRLDRATRQVLFATSGGLGGPGAGGFPMPPGRIIRATQAVLGSHVADDYELLSALAHPVGLVLWSGDADRLPAASITEAQAELLAKVIGSGLHVVGYNALALVDLAAEWTVQLPERGQ